MGGSKEKFLLKPGKIKEEAEEIENRRY